MSLRKEFPINVGFHESIFRIFLIMPLTWLAVAAIVEFHVFAFLIAPIYSLATALTSYDPVKYLWRKISHKRLISTGPFLLSDVKDAIRKGHARGSNPAVG